MKNIYILAALISSMFFGYSANASVYFVNGTTGNAAYDGSTPVYTNGNHGPLNTISAAVSVASANDDIYVSNAQYSETVTLTKNITLHNSSNVRLSDLVMNGTGIGLTLDGNLNITSALTLTDGYIYTDSYSMVIVDYTVAQNGGSKNSFVYGPFGVRVASSASHRMLHFPIGKDTTYRPATIDATPASSNSNIFVGEVFNSAPDQLCTPASEGIDNVSTVRHWCFYTTCTGIRAAKITLAYGSDDGVNTDQTVIIKTDDDTAACWMNICATFNGDNNAGDVTSGCRFYAMGCFALGNVDQPINALPVKLVSFDTKLINPNVAQLKWSTASEINNNYFTIERTTDPTSNNWVTVCRRNGHGTSNVMNNYSCNDSTIAEAGQSVVYYRPKQVDYNGATEYFMVKKLALTLVNIGSAVEGVYPNPATDRLNITYRATENTELQLRLLTTDGRVVLMKRVLATSGQQNLDLELTDDNIAKGVYVLEIASDREVSRHKIYKQ
jgi:hypothetical protein